MTPYFGDAGFLRGPTLRTTRLLREVEALIERECHASRPDVSRVPSSLTAHDAGYVDPTLELIVGLQTDAPLARPLFPNDDRLLDAVPVDALRARQGRAILGLPDSYGRPRIIGDYRRVPLYGVRALIREKEAERALLDLEDSSDEIIRDREELAEQVRALGDLEAMAKRYGYHIAEAARTAREAVQWLYFAYLGAIKEQDGAALSLGRTSTFLDCYFERDLALGYLSEHDAQELVDDLMLKLRMVRRSGGPESDELLAGDRTWITEAIGGLDEDERPLVTKTSFRFLNTLYTLGASPEPRFTVLWSSRLPDAFKRFCAKVSLDTGSLQYESDALLREDFDDDTAIACSASPTRVGRQLQFFGARVDFAQCLLYAMNGGRDELSGEPIMPAFDAVTSDRLELEDVLGRFEHAMEWLARTYVNAMNCIHYMHDKYAYERLAMALHDYAPERSMAFGVAGLSAVAGSLAAIERGVVTVVRGASGLVIGYAGRDVGPATEVVDDRVEHYARYVVDFFGRKLLRHTAYRNTEHTAARGCSSTKLPPAACLHGLALGAGGAPEGIGNEASDRSQKLAAELDALFDGGLWQLGVDSRPPAAQCTA